MMMTIEQIRKRFGLSASRARWVADIQQMGFNAGKTGSKLSAEDMGLDIELVATAGATGLGEEPLKELYAAARRDGAAEAKREKALAAKDRRMAANRRKQIAKLLSEAERP